MAYVPKGHNGFWISEITPSINDKAEDKTLWIPIISHSTGAITNTKINGLEMTNEYIIVEISASILFIPR